MNEDFIKKHLPQYLFPRDKEELVRLIRSSPDNDGKAFYTNDRGDSNYVWQGDGFPSFTFINLLTERKRTSDAMIISNTCDVSQDNIRLSPVNLMYAPIQPLSKMEDMIRAKYDSNRASNLLRSVRRNELTNILYLPKLLGRINESFVRFDMIQNISPSFLFGQSDWKEKRLFTLSHFGFYTTLLKLSVHFHRFQEGPGRGT